MRAQIHLQTLLRDFVTRKDFSWPEKANIAPPKDNRFGDLATNLALVLAGQSDLPPRSLAAELQAFLVQSPLLAQVDVAGPGFCNVTFTPAFWQSVAADVLATGDPYGKSQNGQGKRVQIEYVSANPTGPVHIGHGRGAAIGDSLSRILRFAGYDVSTEYYLNDTGRQMRLLGASVWGRICEILGLPGEMPSDGYQGKYIKNIAEGMIAQYGAAFLGEQGAEQVTSLCMEYAKNSILTEIQMDLQRFRVEHQHWFSEGALVASGAVAQTLAHLHHAGLAYEEDKALWFRSSSLGDDKDRVLRKSDGSLTYFASDITYHDDKFRRGFDVVIDVWGADHHGYIPRMKAAVEALGHDRNSFQVVLVQLVNLLSEGEPVSMSTRAGTFETLADLCEEVGVDAARFIFLSRKSDSPLDVDLELLKKKSLDNPVYYVQYAHARICSMMRKAAEQGIVPREITPDLLARLSTAEDLSLLRAMEQFPDAVGTAAANLSPHHVSYYLTELAGMLHRYYTEHPVLSAAEPVLIHARIHLMRAVAQILRTGLSLLGVEAPERM